MTGIFEKQAQSSSLKETHIVSHHTFIFYEKNKKTHYFSQAINILTQQPLITKC